MESGKKKKDATVETDGEKTAGVFEDRREEAPSRGMCLISRGRK